MNVEKTNENMTVIMDSKSFITALYAFLVYNDFFDALNSFFSQGKVEKGYIELYEWLKGY